VIRQVGWSIDPDGGMTDDPHYAHVAERLGFGKTWVDHQLIGVHRPHKPGFLYPVGRRGHNLKVYR
jgi:LDH2 family malate/lactate/ureidoglycolate dehydrogenase